MASIKNQTMGQTPSRFGMPADGSAFGTAPGYDGLRHRCVHFP